MADTDHDGRVSLREFSALGQVIKEVEFLKKDDTGHMAMCPVSLYLTCMPAPLASITPGFASVTPGIRRALCPVSLSLAGPHTHVAVHHLSVVNMANQMSRCAQQNLFMSLSYVVITSESCLHLDEAVCDILLQRCKIGELRFGLAFGGPRWFAILDRRHGPPSVHPTRTIIGSKTIVTTTHRRLGRG